MNMGERDPRFSDPANYLRDMGARQTADNKEGFAQAFPGAKEAVARAAQEKEDGGIGYLRRLARMQAQAKQRAEEEEKGGLSYIKALADAEAAQKANSLRYLQQAGKFQEMQGDTEDMLNELDPAAQGVKGFDQGGDVEGQGFLGNLQQTVYDATKGFMPDPGELIGGQLDAAEEDPLNYLANTILSMYGGRAILGGTSKFLAPIAAKYGAPALQRATALAQKLVTTPKMSGAGSAVRGPKGKMLSTEKAKEAGLPLNRQFSPARTAVTGALGAKAIDAYMGGEETEEAKPLTEADIFRRDAPAGLTRAIDRNEGEQAALKDMFPDAPEMTAQQRVEERARIARGGGDRPAPRGAGLAGLLEQAKPYASTAASIAQILGRGAGASKGFEGAKFVEESAKIRAAEQARQDRQNALEAQLDLRRAQIDATAAAGQTRAEATLNASIMRELADYVDTDEYRAVVARKVEAGTTEAVAKQEALTEYRADLLRGMGSMEGMGLEQPQGLPAGVTVKRVN